MISDLNLSLDGYHLCPACGVGVEVIVVAATRADGIAWGKGKGLHPKAYRVVSNPEHLRGQRIGGLPIVRTRGYYDETPYPRYRDTEMDVRAASQTLGHKCTA